MAGIRWMACLRHGLVGRYAARQIRIDVSGLRSERIKCMFNEQIKEQTVHLIGANGENLGILPTDAARHLADENGLDLVVVSAKATPPVCKIMDYGKWRYEKDQQEKAARRQQKAAAETKEIRMSVSIDAHDMETKAAAAQKFLSRGNKVKVVVRFRGREMAYRERGKNVLDEFVRRLGDTVKMDGAPRMEGRFLSVFLQRL